MQVEGAVARVLGMEVHLPRLAQRVGLHEMALVVDMEAVVYGMVLEFRHVPSDIDYGHWLNLPANAGPFAGYDSFG
jgi:hypothetical protein